VVVWVRTHVGRGGSNREAYETKGEWNRQVQTAFPTFVRHPRDENGKTGRDEVGRSGEDEGEDLVEAEGANYCRKAVESGGLSQFWQKRRFTTEGVSEKAKGETHN
jgi:hypothetical protein